MTIGVADHYMVKLLSGLRAGKKAGAFSVRQNGSLGARYGRRNHREVIEGARRENVAARCGY